MLNHPPDIIDHYMKLIIQFGFITLFSVVFPPAGLFSFISNLFSLNLKISNLQFGRRFRAEVGNGIGAYMDTLDILCKFSIWTNLGCVYFTSRVYRQLFVKPDQVGFEQLGPPEEPVTYLNLIQFLVVVVVLEHFMMMF